MIPGRLVAPCALVLTCACTPSTPTSVPPHVDPTAAAVASGAVPPAPLPAWTFAVPADLEREVLPEGSASGGVVEARVLPPAPKGVPAPPASCQTFERAAAVAMAACERSQALEALANAVSEQDTVERDAALHALEGCGHFAPGLMRALRADLAPVECADVIVRPLLAAPPAGIAGPVSDAIYGLGLAGMLTRTARGAPTIPPPHTKATVLALVNGAFKEWTKQQAAAIEELARAGRALGTYGLAVVASEAGMADMRFIEALRAMPLADEYRVDPELGEAYLASLEMGLDPRKQRGRDGALVGLGHYAVQGVTSDPRMARTRDLLSRVFGGSPVKALDGLMLPPLLEAAGGPVEQRLAARLPTFYAELILPPEAARDPAMLAALVTRGVAPSQRRALAEGALDPRVRQTLGRFRLVMAALYWRSVDADEAARLLAEWPAAPARTEEGHLMLAVALGLRGGPKNAGQMIVRAPLTDLGLGDTAALDSLVERGGPYRAAASLDAALLRRLAAPAEAGAPYWREVAMRFRKAESLLTDSSRNAEAAAFAEDADATAAIIEARPPAPP